MPYYFKMFQDQHGVHSNATSVDLCWEDVDHQNDAYACLPSGRETLSEAKPEDLLSWVNRLRQLPAWGQASACPVQAAVSRDVSKVTGLLDKGDLHGFVCDDDICVALVQDSNKSNKKPIRKQATKGTTEVRPDGPTVTSVPGKLIQHAGVGENVDHENDASADPSDALPDDYHLDVAQRNQAWGGRHSREEAFVVPFVVPGAVVPPVQDKAGASKRPRPRSYALSAFDEELARLGDKTFVGKLARLGDDTFFGLPSGAWPVNILSALRQDADPPNGAFDDAEGSHNGSNGSHKAADDQPSPRKPPRRTSKEEGGWEDARGRGAAKRVRFSEALEVPPCWSTRDDRLIQHAIFRTPPSKSSLLRASLPATNPRG